MRRQMVSTMYNKTNKWVRSSCVSAYAYAYVAGVLTCLCLCYTYACAYAYALVRTGLYRQCVGTNGRTTWFNNFPSFVFVFFF